MQAASYSKCHGGGSGGGCARDAQNVSLLLLNKSLEKTGTGLSSMTFERCQVFHKCWAVGIIRVCCLFSGFPT